MFTERKNLKWIFYDQFSGSGHEFKSTLNSNPHLHCRTVSFMSFCIMQERVFLQCQQ